MFGFKRKNRGKFYGAHIENIQHINCLPATFPTYLAIYRDGKVRYAPVFGWMFASTEFCGKVGIGWDPIYQDPDSKWGLICLPYPPDEVLGIQYGNENRDWSKEIAEYEKKQVNRIHPNDIIRERKIK